MPTTITLPARSAAYAAGLRCARDRMFLTHRPGSVRMAIPAVIVARRTWAARPVVAAQSEYEIPAARNWSSITSALLMVAIVAMAVLVTGVRL